MTHQGSPFSPSAAATLRSWFVRCPLLPVSRSSSQALAGYNWQATLCNRERNPASRQQALHFPPAAAATPRSPFARCLSFARAFAGQKRQVVPRNCRAKASQAFIWRRALCHAAAVET